MTTITVANYSRKHGGIEQINLTEDVLAKIEDHIYLTRTGELVIGPIDGEPIDKAYKEIVEILSFFGNPGRQIEACKVLKVFLTNHENLKISSNIEV